MKNTVFLRAKKVDDKMTFTVYWKVLVSNFSETGYTVFFWAKKLMERWYLQITGKLLFWIFRRWKYGLVFSQKVDRKMMSTDYWKFLVLSFLVMGNAAFFSAKKLMERWYLLGLFEFSMVFQDLGNMVFRAVSHRGSNYCLRANEINKSWQNYLVDVRKICRHTLPWPNLP